MLKIGNKVKKHKLTIIIILLAFLVQIPRVKGINGSDAFEIIWMAKALKGGLSMNNTWLIHPLSYTGFYPFSFYPIGFPFFISLFLRMNMSIEVVVFLISIIELIITSIGIIKLSNILFKKKIYKESFLICYLFAPIFISITYFTITARGPIIALAPWFFYYFFQNKNESSIILLLKNIAILLIMSMAHRLWCAYIPLLIILFLSRILRKYVKLAEIFNLHTKIYYISLSIIALIFLSLGYFYFGVDPTKITSPWFNNDSILGLIANLIIDYGLRLGIMSILIPVGAYAIIVRRNFLFNDEESGKWFKIICSILLLCFVWTYTLYSTVAYLPIYIILVIYGLKFVLECKPKKGIKIAVYAILGISLIFTLLYAILFTSYYVYFSLLLILITVPSIIYYILKKNDKTKLKINNIMRKITKSNLIVTSFLISNVFFSLTTIDGLIFSNEVQFPYSYISQEEIDICNYLSEVGVIGNIYVSHFQISRRISGYGFYPTLNGNHHGQLIYYEWISEEEIRNSYNFNLYYFITNPNFLFNGPNPEKNILDNLLSLDINTSVGIETIINLKIQYAVILKDSNGYPYPYHISVYGEVFSLFVDSLNLLSYSFETENLLVWKLY